jgi:Ca2+-transporting ATPase
LTPPIATALAIALIPVTLLFLATQLPTLQSALFTIPLTPRQWLTCAGLAALLPIAVELGKAIRRRRQRKPTTLSPECAVAPARAWSPAQA